MNLEVGKTYIDKQGNKVKIIATLFVAEGGKAKYYWPNGKAEYESNSSYNIEKEYKPEDWRCLHYVNEIASLGGESFASEADVLVKFSGHTGFIKAVRVDA